MGTGTFFERIDQFIQELGEGDLTARVVVDQVYAHYQEVGPWRHPRGGEQHALRNSLYEKADDYIAAFGASFVTPAGCELKKGGREVAEKLSDTYMGKAPREYGDLESSGHPIVYDNGAVIYDRPPKTPRLTEAQLRLKHRGVHHRGARLGLPRRRLGYKRSVT